MLLLEAYGDGPYLGKSVELESWTLGKANILKG